MSVIRFFRNLFFLDDYRPHVSDTVRCINCGFRYQAVYPVGTAFPLECRECGLIAVQKDPWQSEDCPPLGVIPEWLWKENRLAEIEAAIVRYENAGKTYPVGWEIELGRLKDWLANRMERKQMERKDPTAQTVLLMHFKVGEFEADVAMGHIGAREFRRAMHAQYPDWDPNDFQYQYAVFNDDESILLNVRPDETGAKPVTVAYNGVQPCQQL